MKVLMFGWEFPPHISGGLGTVCYGLTKGLTTNGIDVLFVLPKVFGDESEEHIRFINAGDMLMKNDESLRQMKERMIFIGVESSIIPYISAEEYEWEYVQGRTWGERQRGNKFPFSGTYGPGLMEEVLRYGWIAGSIARSAIFDVIHVHDWLTFPAGIEAKKISGKPLIAHVHATEFDRSGENVNQTIYNIEKAGMEAADHIIAVSEYTRDILINRYGINGKKIVAIHNAVLPKAFPYNENSKKGFNEKVVTFLGRVTFQKGPDYFVEVARKVLERNKNVRFVMAGNGNMFHEMIRRVAHANISKRFHFTGFLKGGEVDDMLAQTDVYVMPSVSEPFGVSTLEAINLGVPVIISRQAGVAEVLKNAVKIDFWDTDKMADAINGMLNYPALPKTLAGAGREEVKYLTWENQAAKVKNVYESLVQN